MTFIANNQTFTCTSCKKVVPKHPSSSRDHCLYCLVGLHVDIYPGDRANKCGGILAPIGIKVVGQKTQIVYRCRNCHEVVRNVMASDDDVEAVVILSALPVS